MQKQKYGAAARHIASIVGVTADLSKTQLQKICYLLQEFGQTDAKFRFIMYHYGPYSREISQTMRYLQDFGVLEVNEDQEGYGFHITRGKYFDEAADDLQDRAARSLVSHLSTKPSWELELIATAHFVRRILRDHGSHTLNQEDLIEEVHLIKPLYEKRAIACAVKELDDLETQFRPEPATV